MRLSRGLHTVCRFRQPGRPCAGAASAGPGGTSLFPSHPFPYDYLTSGHRDPGRPVRAIRRPGARPARTCAAAGRTGHRAFRNLGRGNLRPGGRRAVRCDAAAARVGPAARCAVPRADRPCRRFGCGGGAAPRHRPEPGGRQVHLRARPGRTLFLGAAQRRPDPEPGPDPARGADGPVPDRPPVRHRRQQELQPVAAGRVRRRHGEPAHPRHPGRAPVQGRHRPGLYRRQYRQGRLALGQRRTRLARARRRHARSTGRRVGAPAAGTWFGRTGRARAWRAGQGVRRVAQAPWSRQQCRTQLRRRLRGRGRAPGLHQRRALVAGLGSAR